VLTSVVENQAAPIFWWILILVGFLATVINTVIYFRTHLSNSERRNFRLKSSIYLTIAWTFLFLARVMIG
jgi:dolichyl-phosphate-mannose--protein O-mannosyl transferase